MIEAFLRLQLPDWVRWVAVDSCGGVFGFRYRPRHFFVDNGRYGGWKFKSLAGETGKNLMGDGNIIRIADLRNFSRSDYYGYLDDYPDWELTLQEIKNVGT